MVGSSEVKGAAIRPIISTGYWKKYQFAYRHLYPGECEAGKAPISRSLGVLAIDFHNNIDEAVGPYRPGQARPCPVSLFNVHRPRALPENFSTKTCFPLLASINTYADLGSSADSRQEGNSG
jgi:hypothetical protein